MARVRIQISVDEELLAKVDQYAEDNYTSRSGVFVQGAANIVNQAAVLSAVRNISLAMRKIADSGNVDPSALEQFKDFERMVNIIVPE